MSGTEATKRRRLLRRRRSAEDEGAALVEFALVLPILALFMFGIVEFGLTLNDYQSLRQGAREGARQAVVADYSGGRAECASGGPVDQVVCLTKARTSVDGTLVRVNFTEGDPDEARDFGVVEVCVAKELSSYSGLMGPFIDGRVISSSIEMRAERQLDGLTSGGDSPPAGSGWEALCN